MKTLFTTTYTLIAITLVVKIAVTVFQLSAVMHHNSLVAQLQQERAQLTTRQEELRSQLASATAIHTVESEARAEYIDIAGPVVISTDTVLASRP